MQFYMFSGGSTIRFYEWTEPRQVTNWKLRNNFDEHEHVDRKIGK